MYPNNEWQRKMKPNRHAIRINLMLLVLFFCCNVEPADGLSATSSSSSRSKISVGEQIQNSHSVQDLLQVAADLWLPTDPGLPSYLCLQRVHHEKRQRWSAQILSKLGSAAAAANTRIATIDWNNFWSDERLTRAVLGAALPFGNDDDDDDDRPNKEGRYVKEALVGLYNLLGNMNHDENNNNNEEAAARVLPKDILHGTRRLIVRAENMANSLSLPDAAETRWACRGILAHAPQLLRYSNDDDDDSTPLALSRLEARVRLLPFDIVPRAIKWNQVLPNQDAVEVLRNAIPFSFDTIVTRTGAAVTERRGTAWIAERGIGALAYSGKLMTPHSLPDIVRTIMRLVEDAVLDKKDDLPRPFFDCALCNHYPDGDSSCRFHTDPEHGTHWERLNCVVAAGDARRFAFRPIPGHSSWSSWDEFSLSDKSDSCDPNLPAVITLFPGDVAMMWGECNDKFHHAVYPESSLSSSLTDTSGRISLVLKRAIPRGDGKCGHSLAGQGRRSRRQQRGAVVQSASRTAGTSKPEQQRKKRQNHKVFTQK